MDSWDDALAASLNEQPPTTQGKTNLGGWMKKHPAKASVLKQARDNGTLVALLFVWGGVTLGYWVLAIEKQR